MRTEVHNPGEKPEPGFRKGLVNANEGSELLTEDVNDGADAEERRFIGERVRLARSDADLTQGELASETGISLRFINYIESGTKGTSTDTLSKIARVTGKDLNWFSRAKPVSNILAYFREGLTQLEPYIERLEKLEAENADLRAQLELVRSRPILAHPPGTIIDQDELARRRARAAEAQANPIKRAARTPKKPDQKPEP